MPPKSRLRDDGAIAPYRVRLKSEAPCNFCEFFRAWLDVHFYRCSTSRGWLAGILVTLHVLTSTTQASTYHQWTVLDNLSGLIQASAPVPDGDGRINALEFAFGSDPTAAEPNAFSPVLRLTNGQPVFTYPVGNDAKGEATYRVFEAEDVEDLSRGVEIDGTPHLESVNAQYSVYSQYFDASADLRFYRLAVKVPLLAAPGAKR